MEQETEKARRGEAVLRTDLATLREAIDHYRADRGHHPTSLEALVDEHYLRAIPTDPITRREGTWLLVCAELEPSTPPTVVSQAETCPLGALDVRSGAEGLSQDGVRYSEF